MSGTAGVTLAGVDKVFPSRSGGVHALADINLTIAEGEIVTLFGPSGCGKSTVLRIIAGLDEATDGEVSVFGETPAQASRRKNIAWIPQSSALLPWLTVKGNADLSRVINRAPDVRETTSRIPEDATSLLEELGLSEFSGHRPSALSGGMRQRASIARGFAQGAPLMLMDEPFSALDELTKDTLQVRLLDLYDHHRKTILFVTHSPTEAVLLSDRVVVMTPRPGRVHGIVDIDLPRPRGLEMTETEAFIAKVAEVKRVLRSGWKEEE